VIHSNSVPPLNVLCIQLVHILGRPAIPFFLLFTLIPPFLTALFAPRTRLRYRILGFLALFATCVRLMDEHGLPRGRAPVVQRHVLLRVGHRRDAQRCPRVANPCGSPGAIRHPAGGDHIQVGQWDRLTSPPVRSPSRPDHRLYVWLLESVDASGTYQYPDMWTYGGRVLQSPGPA
jgi:hypothetical protein